jgi:hypothetical protein
MFFVFRFMMVVVPPRNKVVVPPRNNPLAT